MTLIPIALPPLPEPPRVSIAITCFNYGQYLGECLDSSLAQTRAADEIVVVDDGSSDGSAEVVARYAAQHPAVRLVRQDNQGICAATNAAVAACTGDVVLLLDADDVLMRERVQRVVEALGRPTADGLPGWAHHPLRRFSQASADLGMNPFYPPPEPQGWLAAVTLAKGTPVSTPTSGMAFRRETLAAIGPLAAARGMAQDHQLWTLAALVSPLAWIPEVLARYRMHNQSDSAGGLLSSLAKVRTIQAREQGTHARVVSWLQQRHPAELPALATLESKAGYLWLEFLERWWSGAGKDRRLLAQILAHPEIRSSRFQQRLYMHGARWLPAFLFRRYSALIFGGGRLKYYLRRLIGRN